MKLVNILNPTKKQTLQEKAEDLLNSISIYISNDEESFDRNKRQIGQLSKLVRVWFNMQITAEKHKIINSGKNMIDFMDLNTFELLDIYDENSLINTLRERLPKKIFMQYDENMDFKNKVHLMVLYQILENEENDKIEKALIFSKTFDIDPSISMKYSAFLSKDKFNVVLKKYLENNGSLNVTCYPNYFKENEKERFETTSLMELVQKNKNYQKTY